MSQCSLKHLMLLLSLGTLSIGCGSTTAFDGQEPSGESSEIREPITPGGKFDTGNDQGIEQALTALHIAIDEHRDTSRVWAHVTRISRSEEGLEFQDLSYNNTSHENDFWPASTIKMYTATAGLELLTEWDMSLDAVATFYHESESGDWVEDVSMSFRELIRQTFDCSSNATYTLLLRLAGVDWLHETFFPSRDMFQTALMRGYVLSSEKPYGYNLEKRQRIIVADGDHRIERIHAFSGRGYAQEVGCTVMNENGTANCTTPYEMSEHLKRIILHEQLPPSKRFLIRPDLMAWYRGSAGDLVLNNTAGEGCGGPVYEGVSNVFEDPKLFHKEGLVSQYRGSVHYVIDDITNTEYVVGVMVKSPSEVLLSKISEEVARVMRDKNNYVHLGRLQDNVNPISTDLVVSSNEAGTITVLLKPYEDDPTEATGWWVDPNLQMDVSAGTSSFQLRSSCLPNEGIYHVKAELRNHNGDTKGVSDLHYVVVLPSAHCAVGSSDD